MPNWKSFVPSDFEYDWENDKLGEHGVTFEEAYQTFFNDRHIGPNKGFSDRYTLIGESNGGRKLKIIFQLKPVNVVRIITGWPI
jgi:uncharacterized DUF497 family protein